MTQLLKLTHRIQKLGTIINFFQIYAIKLNSNLKYRKMHLNLILNKHIYLQSNLSFCRIVNPKLFNFQNCNTGYPFFRCGYPIWKFNCFVSTLILSVFSLFSDVWLYGVYAYVCVCSNELLFCGH